MRNAKEPVREMRSVIQQSEGQVTTIWEWGQEHFKDSEMPSAGVKDVKVIAPQKPAELPEISMVHWPNKYFGWRMFLYVFVWFCFIYWESEKGLGYIAKEISSIKARLDVGRILRGNSAPPANCRRFRSSGTLTGNLSYSSIVPLGNS